MENLKIMITTLFSNDNFENSQNFVEDELLDSLDIATLIEELEMNFNIEIDAELIIPENFVSYESIGNLIRISGGIL